MRAFRISGEGDREIGVVMTMKGTAILVLMPMLMLVPMLMPMPMLPKASPPVLTS
jgi:hypothetical protein